ncbi:MAG: aldo/keto reductase [Thermomicrobiales bacterium]
MSTSLQRRQFGSTELRTPPIAVGCAQMGDMIDAFGYGVSEADAISTLIEALSGPIDYIDTAAFYGDGESERRVGLALKELGGLPAGAVLQTKVGRDPKTNIYTGDVLRERMERSLRLLGVDSVDVVYLHDAEWTTFADAIAPGGPVEALRSFKEQGLTRYIGVASGPNDVELQYIETGMFEAVITHNRYTLLNTNANPVIDAAHQRGMAVLNAAPYGSGILARGPETYPRYAYQQASPELIERTVALRGISEKHGVPLAAVALQFSSLDPRIDVTIVGMSRPERLTKTIEYASIDIPQALWDEVNALPPMPAGDPEESRWK